MHLSDRISGRVGHNPTVQALLAILALSPPQTEALSRLESYLAKANQMSVNFTVSSPGYQGKGTGSLAWRRPTSQSLSVAWGPGTAAFRQNASGIIEVNRTTKTYRLFPPAPMLVQPPSEVSGLVGLTYPSVLLAGGLRKELPPETKYSTAPAEAVSGQMVDVVKGTFRGQVDIDVEAAIDPAGRLLRYRIKTANAEMTREVEWTFSNWAPNPSFGPSQFSLAIENGYVPSVLPDQPWPVEVDSPAPLGKWKDARSGSVVDVKAWAKGRWLLLSFVDSESPSAALQAAWSRFRSDLADKKPLDAMVSLGIVKGSSRVFKDSPEIASAWRRPGQPFIALVGPTGKIVWLMFGFSADREKEIRESMRASIEQGE